VILKLLRGSQGIGVKLARTRKELFDYAESTWALDHDFIVQKYYPETKGEDIRILVIGRDVIGGMRRYPQKGDFRSNIHQGGWGKKIELSNVYKTLTKKATRALGLDIAGVDIIETKQGPLIMEVNASPGFEGMEKITGKNIAREMIRFVTGRGNK
jgi:ribosomal protein S6--L-glutamate ligase